MTDHGDSNPDRRHPPIFWEIFGVGSSLEEEPQRRAIEKWYLANISDHLWYYRDPEVHFINKPPYMWDQYTQSKNPNQCRLSMSEQFGSFEEHTKSNLSQIGGARGQRFYQYRDGENIYRVKIVYLSVTDSRDGILGEAYLMSPLEYKTKRRCVLVMIIRDNPKVADLSDVNTYFPCTDRGKPPHAGGLYVNVMTQFLRSNKEQFGIDRIEVTDLSQSHCPQKWYASFYLEMSRQLEGRYPYYVQFGFQPKTRRNLRILNENHQIMSQLLTGNHNYFYRICRDSGCSPEVVDYIASHMDQPMTKTIRYLSRMDCVFFSEVCRTLFKRFGLTSLDEPIYVLRI